MSLGGVGAIYTRRTQGRVALQLLLDESAVSMLEL